MNEFFTEVYGSMSKDVLGLFVVGLAVYIAYTKGFLTKAIGFLKKSTPIGNNVHDRAAAYQLLHSHIKEVGSKTNISAFEALSGLVLKESQND